MNRPQALASRGLSLIEILIALAIVGSLSALLFPLLGNMQKRADNTKCLSNLRALSSADTLYTAEHNGLAVPVRNGDITQSSIWLGNPEFRNYLGLPELESSIASYAPRKFICPEAQLALKSPSGGYYPLTRSYAYNVTGLSYQNNLIQVRPANLARPASTIRMVCSTDMWVDAQKYADSYIGEVRPPTMVPAYRHEGAVNVVFFDGHAESLSRSSVLKNLDQWIVK